MIYSFYYNSTYILSSITHIKMTKCNKCEYVWETKSKMFFVSCPKCRKLVNLKDQVVDVSTENAAIAQSD